MTITLGSIDLNAFSDLYSDSTQYFWFESNSSATYGAGVHVTLVPDTTFINNPTGQNILINTDGFSIRNGLLPMMTLDNDSLDFNIVDTTAGTYTTTATFTATGAQIGQSSGAHSVIDANGQRFYASDGTTQLANIGYGEGQAESGTAVAPYYTFGTRASGSTIGNYSVAEGAETIAAAFASHAEGYGYAYGVGSHAEGSGTARGTSSHAEGEDTKTNANCAHAEGNSTSATAVSSHAEGVDSVSSGFAAHAQNIGTVAQRKSQTTLGEYNIADTAGTASTRGDYAVIVGNGTSTTSRSNALTIDWDGNVDLPTGKFSGVGTTLTYDASNSGTNALEINNASSNALTIDWDGNVEAAGNITDGSGNVLSNLGGVSFTKGVATTSGKTFNLPNNYRGVLYVVDSTPSNCGEYLVSTAVAGGVSTKAISSASNLTINTSTNNKITFTPTTGIRLILFINIQNTAT